MASASKTGISGWKLVRLAAAGVAAGALAGLLPMPWPLVFCAGLLAVTLVVMVKVHRELRRSRDQLAAFMTLADFMEVERPGDDRGPL